MRLIDADTMRQEWLENGQNEYVYDTNAVLDSIDDQPTIDPETLRPTGRWVHDINNLYGCDQCGERETMSPRKMKRYCPNCGAKMTDGNGESDK